MTPLEITLIAILWAIIGAIIAKKQYKAMEEDFLAAMAFILAPIWFIGAIIRQVLIEDWR